VKEVVENRLHGRLGKPARLGILRPQVVLHPDDETAPLHGAAGILIVRVGMEDHGAERIAPSLAEGHPGIEDVTAAMAVPDTVGASHLFFKIVSRLMHHNVHLVFIRIDVLFPKNKDPYGATIIVGGVDLPFPFIPALRSVITAPLSLK